MLSTAMTGKLGQGDLVEVLELCNQSLSVTTLADFHAAILRFAAYIEFDFVLYAYMEGAYDRDIEVHLEDLSNPAGWMQEYGEKNYVESDPVRIELERLLARGVKRGCILWDAYERKISPLEEEIIARRRDHGLHYGCSVFENSERQESVFLVSFASTDQRIDKRTRLMTELIVPHLNRCRQRLALRTLVEKLTPRETSVGDWLIKGKTNREIAHLMSVSERTAKFHVANILSKLEVGNRQRAVSVLLAEKYLG